MPNTLFSSAFTTSWSSTWDGGLATLHSLLMVLSIFQVCIKYHMDAGGAFPTAFRKHALVSIGTHFVSLSTTAPFLKALLKALLKQ